MEVTPREVRQYTDPSGRNWFEIWYGGFKDRKAKGRIWARIRRLTQGNFGDHRALEGGVVELRINVGPGYRVYLGQDGPSI